MIIICVFSFIKIKILRPHTLLLFAIWCRSLPLALKVDFICRRWWFEFDLFIMLFVCEKTIENLIRFLLLVNEWYSWILFLCFWRLSLWIKSSFKGLVPTMHRMSLLNCLNVKRRRIFNFFRINENFWVKRYLRLWKSVNFLWYRIPFAFDGWVFIFYHLALTGQRPFSSFLFKRTRKSCWRQNLIWSKNCNTLFSRIRSEVFKWLVHIIQWCCCM